MKFSKRSLSALTSMVVFTIGAHVPSAYAVEKVTVTAQKREQNLQEVPLSVTAISGEELRNLNITGPGRLELLTPGLNWGNSSGGRAWPTLRGVSTDNGEANGEGALAYHVDGVFKSRTAQANAPLIDVERVEVLRGPQGILFGRNSTGGAINVISKLPSTEGFDYGGDLTLAEFDTQRFDGFANIPLGSNTAARFAMRHEDSDGYLDNIGSGNDLNDEGMFFSPWFIKTRSRKLGLNSARFRVKSRPQRIGWFHSGRAWTEL